MPQDGKRKNTVNKRMRLPVFFGAAKENAARVGAQKSCQAARCLISYQKGLCPCRISGTRRDRPWIRLPCASVKKQKDYRPVDWVYGL